MPIRVLVVASLVAVTTALATLAHVGPAGAARSPVCTRGITTVEVDPRGLLPLTDEDPIGAAATAALRHVAPARRPQVTGSILATLDRERGPQAKFSCGMRVWRRTVVVYILERIALPAQSASQRVFFVGRFKSGYRVWQVVR
jgi:hypothetical protein